MLPEKLSNGLCSLNPDVERLSMVCDMVVDADGIVTAYQFYAAVIRSQARLTYTEVAAALINSRGVEAQRLAAIMPQLRHLHDVYRALLKQRQVRGAIDFETTETQMICDAQGRIERIVPRTRNEAHRLIEEAMLAANVCAAEFIAVNTRLSLYRVHEGPTPEKKTTLQNYLRALGLGLSLSEDPRPAEYQAISQAVRGRPDAHQIQTMLLRSMQQAIYTPVNSGHFGLAYAAYTHFTSPIRRYPDLLVHRTIKAILQGKRLTLAGAGSGAAAQQASWEAAGLHCSTNERRADEASRDVESWLKCRYMRDRLGEEFDGTVSAATSFGLFVQLNTLYVEGLVHITELGGEYYRFDEVRQELRGERTGIRYGIGASVRVQVSRVDLDSRRIDFRLVRPSGEDDPAGVGRSLRRKSRDTRRPFGNTEDSTQAAPSPVEQLEAVQAQDRAARGKLKRAQTRLSELPRLAGGAKLGKAASGTAPTRAPKVAKKAAKRR
jgi:ribonuclease R